MQVVGRACDVCRARISSELDAVACLRCDRAFHDACVTPAPATTYRTTKTIVESAPVSTLCPTCGDDVRLLQRERDEAASNDRRRLRDARAPELVVGSPDIVSLLRARLIALVIVAVVGAALYWLYSWRYAFF